MLFMHLLYIIHIPWQAISLNWRLSLSFKIVVRHAFDPFLFHLAQQDFELRGRLIPAGWQVWLYTSSGASFYNKDAFQPQRWMDNPGRPAEAVAGSQQLQQHEKESAQQAEQVAAGCPFHGAEQQQQTISNSGGSSTAVLNAGGSQPTPFSLPFGSGSRSCVGRHFMSLQLKLLVVLLVREYEWGMEDPGEAWSLFPVVRPSQGLRGFWLKRRNA
jgi:cytochrome P450